MIKIKITPEQKRWARRKANDLGKLRNSVMRGGGNYDGYICQKVAADFFNVPTDQESYDFDFILYSGHTVDVKGTRSARVREYDPGDNFLQKVCASNIRQDCDYYLFAITDDVHVWIPGYYPKQDFFKVATFRKEGEQDNRCGKIFTFRADCYTIEIGKLFKTITKEGIGNAT